jgi:hypothetical protein
LLALTLLCSGLRVSAADDIAPVVEAEEDIYSYTDAQNGAGPMWCTGSTTLVRTDDRLFVSGLETIPDAKPLNNCRWMLFLRENNGWTRARVDADVRTREPSPLVAFAHVRLFLSVNSTLGEGPEPNGGRAPPRWNPTLTPDARSFRMGQDTHDRSQYPLGESHLDRMQEFR